MGPITTLLIHSRMLHQQESNLANNLTNDEQTICSRLVLFIQNLSINLVNCSGNIDDLEVFFKQIHSREKLHNCWFNSRNLYLNCSVVAQTIHLFQNDQLQHCQIKLLLDRKMKVKDLKFQGTTSIMHTELLQLTFILKLFLRAI